MRRIKNFFMTLKTSLGRFLGMHVLCALAFIFASILVFSREKKLIPFVLDFSWMIFAAVFLKLAFEKFFPIENQHSKSARLFVQFIPLVLAIPFYFFCRLLMDDEAVYAILIYVSTFLALVFGCGYFLSLTAREKNFPNIVASGFLSFVLAGCVCAAFSLIVFAIHSLIVSMGDLAFYFSEMFGAFSLYFVLIGTFVSFVTKKYEEISVSKAFKVIFHYALFPLFAVYVLVLYVYFLKVIFTRDIPSGLINPFVSAASFAYMFLYLSLRSYENPAVKFFYGKGAYFMLPLIAFQLYAYMQRVIAYGVTVTRYYSFIYILVSLIFIGFAIGRKKRDVEKFLFPIISLIALLTCLPKINAIDFCDGSIARRIEKIYESHGLFKDGKLITENADSILSAAEKNEIRNDSWIITNGEKNISWYDRSFKTCYGFENQHYVESDDEMYEYGCDFSFDLDDLKINVEGYRTLKPIATAKLKPYPEPTLLIYVQDEGGLKKSFVLDDELNGYLTRPFAKFTGRTMLDEPIVLDVDENARVILTTLVINHCGEGSSLTERIIARGYVLEK